MTLEEAIRARIQQITKELEAARGKVGDWPGDVMHIHTFNLYCWERGSLQNVLKAAGLEP